MSRKETRWATSYPRCTASTHELLLFLSPCLCPHFMLLRVLEYFSLTQTQYRGHTEEGTQGQTREGFLEAGAPRLSTSRWKEPVGMDSCAWCPQTPPQCWASSSDPSGATPGPEHSLPLPELPHVHVRLILVPHTLPDHLPTACRHSCLRHFHV